MIRLTKPGVPMLATIAVLSAIFTLGAADAFAQEPPPATPPPLPPVGGSIGIFGERGQFVVSGDSDSSLIDSSLSNNGGSSTSFVFTPSLDYFISSNFSVGGLLSFAHQSADGGYSRTDVSVGARAGYNIFLTNVLTLWVRGGFIYAHVSEDMGMGVPTGTGNAFKLQVFAPVLWHPASHFFIGLGPTLTTDLVATGNGQDVDKLTEVGIQSTIGGYWGGL